MNEIDRILRRAQQQGWTIRRRGGGHYILFSPDHKGIVTVATSASDRRAVRNILHYMKKHGYKD